MEENINNPILEVLHEVQKILQISFSLDQEIIQSVGNTWVPVGLASLWFRDDEIDFEITNAFFGFNNVMSRNNCSPNNLAYVWTWTAKGRL